jgi:quercetin dioxygenase-like cupin family protein
VEFDAVIDAEAAEVDTRRTKGERGSRAARSLPYTEKGENVVRLKWILPGVAVLALAVSASMAVASHVPQVDPATVPVGFLATHNDVSSFKIAPLARAVKKHRADVTVWHLRLAPNSSLGWHTHPGPAIVTVVRGALGYQSQVRGECVTTWYTAGTGFMDPGFGKVHRAVSRGDGFDAYTTFVLPSGSPSQTIPVAAPASCA